MRSQSEFLPAHLVPFDAVENATFYPQQSIQR